MSPKDSPQGHRGGRAGDKLRRLALDLCRGTAINVGSLDPGVETGPLCGNTGKATGVGKGGPWGETGASPEGGNLVHGIVRPKA